MTVSVKILPKASKKKQSSGSWQFYAALSVPTAILVACVAMVVVPEEPIVLRSSTDAPLELHLWSMHHYSDLSGQYNLMPDKMVHGMPVWKHVGSPNQEKFLFSSTKQDWVVGSHDWLVNGANTGWLRSPAHRNNWPHETDIVRYLPEFIGSERVLTHVSQDTYRYWHSSGRPADYRESPDLDIRDRARHVSPNQTIMGRMENGWLAVDLHGAWRFRQTDVFQEDTGTIFCTSPPPEQITVSSTVHYTDLSGVYELVKGMTANGLPVWRQAEGDQDKAVYSSKDGEWAIGFIGNAKDDGAATGWLKSQPHKGRLPHQVRGFWSHHPIDEIGGWSESDTVTCIPTHSSNVVPDDA